MIPLCRPDQGWQRGAREGQRRVEGSNEPPERGHEAPDVEVEQRRYEALRSGEIVYRQLPSRLQHASQLFHESTRVAVFRDVARDYNVEGGLLERQMLGVRET